MLYDIDYRLSTRGEQYCYLREINTAGHLNFLTYIESRFRHFLASCIYNNILLIIIKITHII